MSIPTMIDSRSARALMLASFLLVLTACGVASIAPIVPWEERSFDPALLGTWANAEGKEMAVITGDSASDYQLAFTDDDGRTGLFDAKLGRLGPHRVLDLQPNTASAGRQSAYYESLMLPMHAFVIIDRVTASELEWRMVHPDSVAAVLAREPGLVPHQRQANDEGVVLTGSTAEVRRFFEGFVRRPGMLSEGSRYARR